MRLITEKPLSDLQMTDGTLSQGHHITSKLWCLGNSYRHLTIFTNKPSVWASHLNKHQLSHIQNRNNDTASCGINHRCVWECVCGGQAIKRACYHSRTFGDRFSVYKAQHITVSMYVNLSHSWWLWVYVMNTHIHFTQQQHTHARTGRGRLSQKNWREMCSSQRFRDWGEE